MKSNSDIQRMLHQDAENISIDMEFKKDLKKRIMMQGKEKETVKTKNSGKLIYLKRASAAAVMAIVIGGTSIGMSGKLGVTNKNSQGESYAFNETQKKDSNNVGAIDVYLNGNNVAWAKVQEEKVLAIEDNKSQKENSNTPTDNANNQKQNSLNSNSTNNDNSKPVKNESENSNKTENPVVENTQNTQNTVSEEKPVQSNVVTDLDKVYAVSGNGEASNASETIKNNDNKAEDAITKTLLQEENKIYIMDIKTKEKVQIDEGRKAELIENGNYVAYIKDEPSLSYENSVTTSQSMNLEKNNSSVWIYNVKTKEKRLIIKCSDIKAETFEKDSSNKDGLTKSTNSLLGKIKVEESKYTFSGLMWSKSAKQLYLLVNEKETSKENLIRLQFKIEPKEKIEN